MDVLFLDEEKYTGKDDRLWWTDMKVEEMVTLELMMIRMLKQTGTTTMKGVFGILVVLQTKNQNVN